MAVDVSPMRAAATPRNDQGQCNGQPNEASEKRHFIDLFSGCGGLSLGLMHAGWQGLFAIEHDALAFETLKHNLINGDGEQCFDWPEWLPKEPLSIQRLLSKYGDKLDELDEQVDLIAGGPPCQGFSFAGKRVQDDARNRLFEYYLKVVHRIRPKMVIMENVQGIAVEMGKKHAPKMRGPGRPREPYAKRIERGLVKVGYKVARDTIASSAYGVPQQRERYFIVAHREDIELDVDPLQAMRDSAKAFRKVKGLDGPPSIRQAIGDLEARHGKGPCPDSHRFKSGKMGPPASTYQRLMRKPRSGGSIADSHRFANHTQDIVERWTGMLRSERRGVRLRPKELEKYGTKKISLVILDPNRPCHTLTTLPDDLVHYSEPRILTVREYARIQSFPDSFVFRGKYTTGGGRRTKEVPRYSQIGNAVPPLVAEAWGATLKGLLAPMGQVSSASDEREALRVDIPKAEAVANA